MRNLKRALSLTLASVMLLGMMVVGSSAASYPDVDSDEHNIEAIDVLQTVGVMVGDADTGNFRPNDNVKRSEMARIMADLMDLNYDYYTGSNPFTDMQGHWAEKYVAACYTNGIIAGRTETTYDPEATVTAVEAAAMLMRALGYFQNKDADYQGGFVVATVRQAGKIDLFNDVATKTNDPMTRNDVAQLVLNTLKSGMVEPDNDSKIDIDLPGGGSVSIGATNYVYVTSREKYSSAIYDTKNQDDASSSANLNAPIVELGEKLYQGDLKLKDWRYSDETDAFGRPATTWTYQAKDIGTYAEATEDNLTFTAKVTPKKLYDAVGKTAAEKYDWVIKLDGKGENAWNQENGFAKLVENQNNDNAEFSKKCLEEDDALTGNGSLTQVYVDGIKEQVVVAITHYYAAEVYKVKDGKITLSNLDSSSPAGTNDEFETNEFDEDDIVYYTFAKDKIQSVDLAERIEGTVTKVVAKVDDSDGSNFNLGDDNYKYNMTVSDTYKLITENVDNDMVGYLDGNGYVIYVDQAAVSYDYAYVLAVGSSDFWGENVQKDYSARLLLTDGSMITVDIDYDEKETNPEHHIVSYTKGKDGVYSLSIKDTYKEDVSSGTDGIKDVTDDVFSNGKASISAHGGPYVANSNTVFLVADTDGKNFNSWDFTVYTGVKNAPTIDKAENAKVCVAATDNGIAKVVYVQDADVSGNGEVVFVIADAGADLTYLSGTTRYHELTALMDGEVTSIYVKRDSDADDLLVNDAIENFNDGGDYAGRAIPVSGKLTSGPNAGKYTKFIVPVRLIVDNSENQVTNVKVYDALDADNDGALIGIGTDRENRVGNEVVLLEGKAHTWSDKVKVGIYDMESEKLASSRMSSVKKDTNNVWVAVLDGNQIIGLCVVDVKEGGAVIKPPQAAALINTLNIDLGGETIKRSELPGGDLHADGTCVNGSTMSLRSAKAARVDENPVIGSWQVVRVDATGGFTVKVTINEDMRSQYKLAGTVSVTMSHGEDEDKTPVVEDKDTRTNNAVSATIKIDVAEGVAETIVAPTGTATVDDNKITGVEYSTTSEQVAGGVEIELVDNEGNFVGTVTVAEGGGTTLEPVTSDNPEEPSYELNDTVTAKVNGQNATNVTVGEDGTATITGGGAPATVKYTVTVNVSPANSATVTGNENEVVSGEKTTIAVNAASSKVIKSVSIKVGDNEAVEETVELDAATWSKEITVTGNTVIEVVTGNKSAEIASTSTLLSKVGNMPTKVAGSTSDTVKADVENGNKKAMGEEAAAYVVAMNAWKKSIVDAIAAVPGVYTIDAATTRAFNWEKMNGLNDETLTAYASTEHWWDVDGNVYLHGWMLDNEASGKAGKGRIVFSVGTSGKDIDLKIFDKNGNEINWFTQTLTADGNIYVGNSMNNGTAGLTKGESYSWTMSSGGEVLYSGAFVWEPFGGIPVN